MKRTHKLLQTLSLVALATGVVGAGGVNRIPDPGGLSPETIVVNLDDLSCSVDKGNRLASAWGVTFSSIEPLRATFEVLEEVPVVVSMPEVLIDYAVVNRPLQRERREENRNRPLIVDLERPVWRAGFQLLGASNSRTQATLEAFDEAGNPLGTVSYEGLGDIHDGGSFVGIESTDTTIAKILIDYGDDTTAETVLQIFLDYKEPYPFVALIPQIGSGPLGDGSRLETSILFSNLSSLPATGSIFLHFDSEEEGAGADREDFSLEGFAVRSILVTGNGTPSSGYAVIESAQPLTASALYRIVDGEETVLFEAGVGSSPPRHAWTGSVSLNLARGVNAGLALINPSSESVLARIILREKSLTEPMKASINLRAGEHRALFLDELFDELGDGPFEGTVQVRSVQPISVVTLRTRDGRPLSSLPLGGTER